MAVSKMANRSAIRSMLDAFGLEAKYELGQNFLVDDTVVAHILELADVAPSQTVLEVGPGCGTLTCALLPRAAAVVAIEADADMQGPLGEVTAEYSERFALVMGDATKVAPAQISEALAGLRAKNAALADLPDYPSAWVANLPYAVAATLILQYFQEWPFIQDATVMVQSEVADRICALPSSKIYGAYTVKLQLFAQVVGRFQVPPRSFFPEPHVDSAVVRLQRVPACDALSAEDAAATIEVVDAAFASVARPCETPWWHVRSGSAPSLTPRSTLWPSTAAAVPSRSQKTSSSVLHWHFATALYPSVIALPSLRRLLRPRSVPSPRKSAPSSIRT